MSGLKVITFTGSVSNQTFDMTVEVPEGATLVLKQARFDIEHVAGVYSPRHINVNIGTTISSDHVIDNNPKANYLKIGLDFNSHLHSSVNTNISVTYPDSGYLVSGRINKYCTISLYDENFSLLGSDLKYYFLQFAVY